MKINKATAPDASSKKGKVPTHEKLMMVLVTIALALPFIPKSMLEKLYGAEVTTSAVLVQLHGTFTDGGQISAEKTIPLLKELCSNTKVKTLVLHMSSGGGSAIEGERISDAVGLYCEKKRVITLVEGHCLSACYDVAANTDEIWSNRYGSVGSIGSMFYWADYSAALERFGVKEIVIASGAAKGPTISRQMPTKVQAEDMQAAITSSGVEFARIVRERRKGRIAKEAPIETGGIFSAQQALKFGLIDDIKTIDQVRDRFGKDLTEIGTEATGNPNSDEPRNRGEELFDLALQKAREAIRGSK